MGESMHDGPEASITNAALCAAMQRVLSKCRCNFMMACFVLSMLHACKQQTGRFPAKCRCCRLAFFFWHKGTRETPVVKRITRICTETKDSVVKSAVCWEAQLCKLAREDITRYCMPETAAEPGGHYCREKRTWSKYCNWSSKG